MPKFKSVAHFKKKMATKKPVKKVIPDHLQYLVSDGLHVPGPSLHACEDEWGELVLLSKRVLC